MRRSGHIWIAGWLAVLVVGGGVSCAGPRKDVADRGGDDGKVPITTSSERARQAFLTGRALSEDLKVTEARPYFSRAVALDPSFAQAWLALATTAGTAQDLFTPLRKAVERADRVTAGERHMILGFEAGVNRDLAGQFNHYQALVRRYPKDERARVLLGTYFMARQDYDAAIGQFRRATKINPDFAPAFNQLGYAYRLAENFHQAEIAFKRYIELLPEQPNPYDSYAELLMKVGRFEESIQNYQIAMQKDPEFLISLRGIGYDQTLLGRYADAHHTFDRFLAEARNDGERRQALFWDAVAYLHEGSVSDALQVLERRAQMSRDAGDLASLSGDMNVIGMVYLNSERPVQALRSFQQSVKLIGKAEVGDGVRRAVLRAYDYRRALVALERGDLDLAAAATQSYAEGVAQDNVPQEVQRLHELLGRLAWARGDLETARQELELANPQDPWTPFLLARVLKDLGQPRAALDSARRAANYNGLNFNYAFVRAKANAFVEQIRASGDLGRSW